MIFEKLKNVFGLSDFRPGQEDLIKALLTGRDVVGILPTGGGKSLCYQLPALLMDGLTIVVSPLISLMKDQVDGLKDLGIDAAILNTSVSDTEYYSVFQDCNAGKIKLLYVAPERLENNHFINNSVHWNISMIAVDEAHCVSQWGHDFRPGYQRIFEYINLLPTKPVVGAFTATATVPVKNDIIEQLKLNNPLVVVNSFDRPNIYFEAKSVSSKLNYLKNNLPKDKPSVVYCNTRKACEEVLNFLKAENFSVAMYHAGMTTEERKASQDAFMDDYIKTIVATNAFGMGIDKPDIRYVFHYNMPKNLEAYYQEAGRAGRDGFESKAILLYSKKDFSTARFLIRDSKEPFVHEKLNKMIAYCNSSTCLRSFILEYFGEKPHTSECKNCSVCLGDFTTEDKTIDAQKVLSCIYRMNQSFGMSLVCDVLRGSKNKKVLERKFDELSTYGLMKDYSESYVKDLISELLTQEYLFSAEFQVLKLTKKSIPLLNGNTKFSMKARAKSSTPEKKSTVTSIEEIKNKALYESLKILRSTIAQKAGVPNYIVFSNASLIDMADKMPSTLDEFLEVQGVGSYKQEKYGKVFLDEIQKFVDNQ